MYNRNLKLMSSYFHKILNECQFSLMNFDNIASDVIILYCKNQIEINCKNAEGFFNSFIFFPFTFNSSNFLKIIQFLQSAIHAKKLGY